MLKFLINSRILQQLGHDRVSRFLESFEADLATSNLSAPPPLPATHFYFTEVADFLADTEHLPPRLLQAMSTIETAAVPENESHLSALIQAHIPDSTDSNPLARALNLWLAGHLSSSLAAPESDEGRSSFSSSISESSSSSSSSSCSPADSTVQTSAVQSSTVSETLDSAPRPHSDLTDSNLTDLEAIRALASLSPVDYDRTRKEAARSLRVRVETLDAEVTRVRNQLREDAMFNTALRTLHSPEPWPEAVNGADVLTQIAERFRYYLVLPPGADIAFTLWSAHAHCFSAFIQSPRLNISSPEPGCGKTTALDVIAALTPRALRTENLTAPVLFRLVDQYQPTLLLDEIDAWLPQAEELRGLLNAGHKRGACAYRCEGEGNAVRPYRAFGPAALAGIGQLTGTLLDRSVVVPLIKAEAGQIPARFDDHHVELETELCRKLARWTADNFAALKSCDPPLPPTAFNRLADNWRPLFAIAQIAGDPWPDMALSSFNHLANPPLRLPLSLPPLVKSSTLVLPKLLSEGGSSISACEVQGSAVQGSTVESAKSRSAGGIQGSSANSDFTDSNLINCIRSVFAQSGTTRISSQQLAEALTQHSNTPGPHQSSPPGCRPRGRFTPITLSRRLRQFGIKPKVMRFGDHLAKGYDLSDFPQFPTEPRP